MAIISKERFILSILLNVSLKPPEPLNEPEPVTKGGIMPIKDQQKAREYKRRWMANKRKQQKENVEPVEPSFVEPLLNVEPVEPIKKVEPRNNFVEPQNVEPKRNVEPYPRHHYSLIDLFQQATIKIKQDYQTIYKDSETARKCFDCHNRERNYQILLNLLERYWIKVKRLEKPSFVGDQKGEPSM